MLSRFGLVLALCLSAIVFLFPAASSGGNHYCTVGPANNPPCIGPWNNWNYHAVYNFGPSRVFCGVYQPSGAQESSAFLDPGDGKTLSAWLYNRLICWNQGGQTTTLSITDY